MYYKLQGYAADPHLKPEEMQAAELGVQHTSASIQAKMVLYYHHGRNMIDWISDTSLGNAAVWQSVNHTRINNYGLETYLQLDFQQIIPQQHTLQAFDVSYSYISQNKDLGSNIVSQYALEYLRHKLVTRLKMQILHNLNIGLYYRWQDRVGSYTDFNGEVHDYLPFGLIDARLSWDRPSYAFYAEINNLLNKKDYVDYANVPQPGLWAIVGVKYSL